MPYPSPVEEREAKAIMVALVVALTFFSLLVLAIPALASPLSPNAIVEASNASRVSQGLQALKVDPGLNKAAQAKADDMEKRHYFAHTSPQGKNLWTFIFGAHAKNLTVAGENLAKGFQSVEFEHTAWLASPTHKANILDTEWKRTGVGISGEYVVQLFAD